MFAYKGGLNKEGGFIAEWGLNSVFTVSIVGVMAPCSFQMMIYIKNKVEYLDLKCDESIQKQ